eukprot:1933245-Amphidinium_carterae.1
MVFFRNQFLALLRPLYRCLAQWPSEWFLIPRDLPNQTTERLTGSNDCRVYLCIPLWAMNLAAFLLVRMLETPMEHAG